MTEDTNELTPQQKAALTRKKNKEAKAKESTDTFSTFGVIRKQDGWYCVETVISGDKVINKNEIGPLMRAIAVEEFKINAQRFLERME